jgi:multicomponent Na+:H+ antiporter subunit D
MHAPVLTIIPLLLGSFLAVMAGWTRKSLVYPIGVLALILSSTFSVQLVMQVLSEGTMTYDLGGWSPPWGIVFIVDSFSAFMIALLIIGALATFVTCRDEIMAHFEEKSAAFVSLILLTLAGHVGIVSTGDLFNLYVLIEVAALTGYALLGLGNSRAVLSSLNYLCIGSVGASLYLLGVGYLYMLTGSLNMTDLTSVLQTFPPNASLRAAIVVLFLGLWVKMALFPFHGWLPGAYSNSSATTATLLAPMTTKVMAYVVIRLLTTVFPGGLAIPEALPEIAVVLATLAIFAGSAMAFRQTNIRRMLAYIVVAEVGYMVGGAFIGNRMAMTGAMLHILADAAMTLTLFLAVCNIARKRGSLELSNLQGLFKSMPFTMAAFVLGAMSMIGVPPLFGFFSKWHLLTGALQAEQYPFMVALIISSLVNVVLFFRFFEVAFFEKPENNPGLLEVRWIRVAPVALVALLLIAAGLSTGLIVDKIIAGVIPASLI